MAGARRADPVPPLIGALLVLLGTRMPAVELPVWGGLSWMELGTWPALLTQGGAVLALLGLLAGRAPLMGLATLALWGGLLWPFLGETVVEAAGYGPSNPAQELGALLERSAGRVTLDVSELSWGGAVILAGTLLVTRASWGGGDA